MVDRIDRTIYWIAYIMAVLGGIVLCALMLMTTVSVAGRAANTLGLGPVPGDFELVSAGTAFCIFAFLPWCQLKRGHVTVDLFLINLGVRVNFFIDIIANLLMTVAAAIVAWRLYAGMVDKMSYGETTFILQFPLWWAFAACVVGAVIYVLICLYTVWRSLREYKSGNHVTLAMGRNS